MQPGEKLPCYRAAFPMRRLRDIAGRHSVQIFFVGSGEGLADLRKETIVARKDSLRSYIKRRRTSFWRAMPGAQKPQNSDEKGNRGNDGNGEFTHGFSSSRSLSLNARRRRFTSGENSR